MNQRFYYGGQAVIEGVLIRGRRYVAVAVRRPAGDIATWTSPLGATATTRWRKVPFVRGILVLAETFTMGMRALLDSARVAGQEQGDEEISPATVGVTIAFSLAFAVLVFFVSPTLLVRLLDPLLQSPLLSNVVEGIVRLALFLGYVVIIGRMAEVRRVFAYHGAEHMTVHAHEHGEPLETQAVRRYPTAHERCGTAFLLTVMVVAIVVFILVGRIDNLWLRLLSRIALVPLVAGAAYEIIRLSARFESSPLVRLLIAPNLALQALTTRQPDDAQIEVAIAAMNAAIAADEGRPVGPMTDALAAGAVAASPPAQDVPTEPDLPGTSERS
ncbi:MAG: DUF1385 domain-containing protein [Dehalococcoidia bacterium]|nr:DUF1385 domain-containing protein [Dehalococcoidia bacterium]